MAQSFIGKPISLISHSDVRYRGILAGIDAAASTIQLSNVYSMGTETRRPPAEFIPPVQEPYQYIIFRASEVKDLAVDDAQPPRRSVHDDPAVLAAPPSQAPATSPYIAPAQHAYQQQQPIQQPYPQQQSQPQPPQAQPPQVQTQQPQRQAPPLARRTNNSVHTAAASLETVERAIGDLRVSNAQGTNSNTRGRSGGRGGRGTGRGEREQGPTIPNTDFDFQTMNAKFDKVALGEKVNVREAVVPVEENGSASKEGNTSEDTSAANAANDATTAIITTNTSSSTVNATAKSPTPAPAYDPSKSFFDTLSSTPSVPQSGGRSSRRGGRGNGMSRREEERERNVATFGEPGGVGLMGPGAYVGGWGGYGRRGGQGGSRGRRGGAPTGQGPQGQAVGAR
ncbi:hypothetical protein H0H93_001168 [Arthromyces matolae]|nr:hypothetical protein H0H93_001168 [Arthromyces matolae]